MLPLGASVLRLRARKFLDSSAAVPASPIGCDIQSSPEVWPCRGVLLIEGARCVRFAGLRGVDGNAVRCAGTRGGRNDHIQQLSPIGPRLEFE